MSGIYIHIPFCKQACHYCNFHFSTSLIHKKQMVDAICREIHLRHHYLDNKNLTSIYFGGGTPSLLGEDDLASIFDALSTYFFWTPSTEITLEANPDDLDIKMMWVLKKLAINRLSIGVQSFFDDDLRWMNRSHQASQSLSCIQAAQDVGFQNLTIDLIYGGVTTTSEMWEQNIDQALKLKLPHISAYCLTVEEKTVLHHWVKTKQAAMPDPEQANKQFLYMIQKLTSEGYDHYEISNFGKPTLHAVHNTNYWKGAPYLGIGPSAHSYNGTARSWNIAHNKKYIDAITQGDAPQQIESLTPTHQYNEYVMTNLRTMWGLGLDEIFNIGVEYGEYFTKTVTMDLNSGLICQKDNRFYLTTEGKFFADRVAMHLFYVED